MNPEVILKKISVIAQQLEIEVYAVGGFVRDQLLQRPVKDIDFVVVGDGLKFARVVKQELRATNLVQFERFGTAMIKFGEHQLEFVSARSEAYAPDSRKPIVAPSDLFTDLQRRDFTVNTLAMSIKPGDFGKIIDPFHGQEDLKAGIIRTPLDPGLTFSDDPLRILRAVRFATQLHFTIEKNCLQALSQMAERLRIISQERITDELMKILAASQPSIGFRLLDETRLLPVILPEIEAMKGVEQRGDYHHKDVFYHTIQVIDNVARVTSDLRLRFAALVHDIGKPRTKAFKPDVGWTFHAHDEIGARMIPVFCRRLKLPLDFMKYIQKLVQLHLRPIALVEEEVTDSAIRRLMALAGNELEDLMLLCRADITSGNPQRVQRHLTNFDSLLQRIQAVEEKDAMRAFQSPVRGDEIMQVCQLNPGPLVGKLKKMIEEAILDGIIPYEHDAALTYLLKCKAEVLKTEM
ncbi:CCA tRNA nucleotidyltransferase [candidate division KSB1 bacterium]|nr:CCA tRNA nucleotidyltransferase [candidate division KSB1 bacterium]